MNAELIIGKNTVIRKAILQRTSEITDKVEDFGYY